MIKDLKDQVFDNLTVIEFAGLNKRNKATWRCKCTCGEEVVLPSTRIQSMRYCGNQKAHRNDQEAYGSRSGISGKVKNLKGKVFGDLTVIEFAGLNEHNKATWCCKCICGKEDVYTGGKIQNTRYCGDQEAHDEALGKVKDAAYKMANFKGKILTGSKSGELTVGKMVDFHDIYGPIWSCQCSCGVTVELDSQVIRTRARCGRYHNENIVKRDVEQRLSTEADNDNNN